VLREAGKGLNVSENQALTEIYALGRNASDAAIKDYIIGKALDELGLTTNTTFFRALLDLDDGASRTTHSRHSPATGRPPTATTTLR